MGILWKLHKLKKCTQKNLPIVAKKNVAEWNTQSGLLCSAAPGLCRYCSKGQVELQRPTLLPGQHSATQGTHWGPLTCQGCHSFCRQQGINQSWNGKPRRSPASSHNFRKKRQLRIWSLWAESKTYCVGFSPQPARPISLRWSLCVQKKNLQLMSTEHKACPPPWMAHSGHLGQGKA